MSFRRGRGVNVSSLDLLLAGHERAVPRLEVDHRAVVVAEVAQEPPKPLGTAHAAVGNDEDTRADACSTRGVREVAGIGERMPSTRSRRPGQIGVDVEEARAGYVAFEVQLAPPTRAAELPPAVDELVAHHPSDAGRATTSRCALAPMIAGSCSTARAI